VETSPVTIDQFIAKWTMAELKERAATYGWEPSIGNDEILRELLALNALHSTAVSLASPEEGSTPSPGVGPAGRPRERRRTST
jgi:hypothetical protein